MKITNEKLRRAIEELSEETIVKLLETQGFNLEPPKPKPEPEFEKIQFCHLRVDVPDPTNSFPIHLSWAGSENNTCLNSIKAIERHINGLQKAIAFTQENNGQ